LIRLESQEKDWKTEGELHIASEEHVNNFTTAEWIDWFETCPMEEINTYWQVSWLGILFNESQDRLGWIV
jgi:hypothetical protein